MNEKDIVVYNEYSLNLQTNICSEGSRPSGLRPDIDCTVKFIKETAGKLPEYISEEVFDKLVAELKQGLIDKGTLIKTPVNPCSGCGLGHGGWETAKTETFICEDCGIKYKKEINKRDHWGEREEDNHWILPKGFKPTCTQKQVNYARVLWNKLFRQPYWEEDNIYFTSAEQASVVIGELLAAIEKRNNRDAFRNGIIDKLTLAGFGYASGYLHPDNTTTEVWKDDITKDYATYKMNWETKTVSFTVNLHFENSVEITPETVDILETVKANKETIEKILNKEVA